MGGLPDICIRGLPIPSVWYSLPRLISTKQLGFVINQLSGAGCDHMGNFPTLPIAGALRVSPDSILNMQTPVGKEIGTAGYYAAP